MIKIGFSYRSYVRWVLKCTLVLSIAYISAFGLLINTFAYGDSDSTDGPIQLYQSFNEDIKIYIEQMSEIYKIPQEYIYGIIYNESRFQSDSLNINKNKSRDYGLMQINSSCFKFLKDEIGLETLKDLFDPYTNINAAFALLNYHYESTEDNNLMLLRYQVGEGRYDEILSNNHRLPDSFRSTYKAIDTYRQYFNWKAIMEYKDDILIY